MTTERMIRGMNIEERCSPEESMSHAADAVSSWEDTGFRLVHDSVDRCIRGGSWHYISRYTRVAARGSSEPNLRRGDLSFRLTRGDT